ncbi:MAG TPA: DUF2339 domain-containing protein, partial [Caulobacteraceae bacterium]|nr:DUF2339 domain-containing protein [Caulobacteraceae bacterium]
VLSHRLQAPLLAAVAGIAALVSFAGARLQRRIAPVSAEALATAALASALTGAFLVLHSLLAGPAAAPGGRPLLEAALRTDLLLAVGLMLAFRAVETHGRIGRWRLIVVVALGAVQGLLVQGLILNPWWGFGEAPAGPPLFDTLALDYLAPALLLAVIAVRTLPVTAVGARLAAVAAFGSGLIWAMLEIRRLAHGPDLRSGIVERPEGAGFGVVLLLAALGLAWLKRRRDARASAAGYLAAIAQPFAWVALGLATLALCLHASPWWGPIADPLDGPGEAAAIFATIALGAGATFALAASARRDGWPASPQAATGAGVADLFVLTTLLVRWLFHGEAMRAPVRAAGAETWTFSATWALFGLAVLVAGGVRRDVTLRWCGLVVLIGTVLKVLLFDMSRLDGAVRAGSFLAVGALLVAGAILARRLNADSAAFFRLRRSPPASPPPEGA